MVLTRPHHVGGGSFDRRRPPRARSCASASSDASSNSSFNFDCLSWMPVTLPAAQAGIDGLPACQHECHWHYSRGILYSGSCEQGMNCNLSHQTRYRHSHHCLKPQTCLNTIPQAGVIKLICEKTSLYQSERLVVALGRDSRPLFNRTNLILFHLSLGSQASSSCRLVMDCVACTTVYQPRVPSRISDARRYTETRKRVDPVSLTQVASLPAGLPLQMMTLCSVHCPKFVLIKEQLKQDV